jgi:predicted tellurium resistance membrane protein TerC
MEWLSDPQAWAALATLTALEIVLGIDNIIFISILVGRLPARQREKARVLGLGLAMLTRLALLMSLVWVMGLNASLFTLLGNEISGRDLILLGGGLFLLIKSTSEIHESLEGATETRKHQAVASFGGVLVQIAIIDIVFSLDSVITAVGLAQQIAVMAIAIVLSVAVMMFAARAISDFVDTHPTIKMLALSFLILVGTALIAEGLDFHVPRGYIYFAMAFSVAVEMLNLRMRRRAAPVKLHKPVARKRRA